MKTARAAARRRKEVERAQEALKVKQRRMKNTECRRRCRALEQIRLQSMRSTNASSENAEILSEPSADRAAMLHARELAILIHKETSARGLAYQKVVIEKLLDQPLLHPALPECVLKRKELQYCRTVCNGVADAWSTLKYGNGRDGYLARNVIEAAIISVGEEECMQAARTCVGMNKRTVRRAVERRRRLNRRANGEVWAKIYRKKRKDALDQSVIDVVTAWWTDETRVSPCKKEIRTKRVSFKRTISHTTHWLEESQLNFYTRFKAANTMKVSFACFWRLKPFFVRRLQDLLLSLPLRDGRNHSGLEYDEEVHGPRGRGSNRMFLRLSISLLYSLRGDLGCGYRSMPKSEAYLQARYTPLGAYFVPEGAGK